LEEKEVPFLKESLKEQQDLGENINEECRFIEGELERLTQVLFEEVNLLVSTEARAKHEELVSTQELEEEVTRAKQKIDMLHRRFKLLKRRYGKLVKQFSEPDMRKSPNTSGGSLSSAPSRDSLRITGSSKALDELLNK
jgi:hypothetical protein